MALDIELLKTDIQAAFDAASDISVEDYTDVDTGDLDTASFSAAVIGAMASAFAEAINTFVTSAEVEIEEATLDSVSFKGNLLVSRDKEKLTTSGNKHYYTLDPDQNASADEAYNDEDITYPTISGNVTVSGGNLK